MTDDSLQGIADRAAAKAVRETLALVGIDVSNPIRAQEQFAFLRALAGQRTKENLEFLERIHSAAEKVTDTGWRTTTRILIVAAIGFVGVALRDHIAALFSFSGK